MRVVLGLPARCQRGLKAAVRAESRKPVEQEVQHERVRRSDSVAGNLDPQRAAVMRARSRRAARRGKERKHRDQENLDWKRVAPKRI
ncbi:MAG TPA: hypothetical protein VHW01_19635, partial [Polyangiaceae bacterium]|nr:hypothetical protein [Polyangiaceae bacterium]